MQVTGVIRQSCRRGHRLTVDPKSRVDAGVKRDAVDKYRARTAISRVAALLDLEMVVIAKKGAKALPGSGAGGEGAAINLEADGPGCGCLRPSVIRLLRFAGHDCHFLF